MDENFEQDQRPLTVRGIDRVGHDSIRLMKWMTYFGFYFEKKNLKLFFDHHFLSEISER